MDIFEFAMEKEKLSEEYYRILAGKTENKGLKTILNTLADEEMKHYEVVLKMKDGSDVAVSRTTVLADAKAIFTKMKQSREKFRATANEAQLYRKAMDIEQESRSFYLRKAQDVSDERQKEIFNRLAEEENKHYFLVENLMDFVSRPATWLENAEFNHLDEY
jgi:rubrerythrin